MKLNSFLVGAVALGFASPAAAVVTTFALKQASGSTNATSFAYPSTGGALTLTTLGRLYSVAPTALNSLSQIGSVAQNLNRSAIGTGVCSAGEGNGSQCVQVDTSGANEVLRANFSKSVRITRLVLSSVDQGNGPNDLPDTLRLYGLNANGNTLDLIGFGGAISQLAVASGGTYTGTAGGTATIRFEGANALPKYSSFFFTSNNGDGDGYRINSISAAVPEPASWAMMLGGFGLLGGALRGRKSTGMATVTA